MPISSDFNELVPSFVIEERSGDARQVILTGRALPYRPLSLSGSQRNTVEWYPGNPIGVLQVYGAKEEPTTVNGYWKDVFLGSANYALVDGFPVATARDLANTVDDIRRKGQEVKVTWLNHVRFGVLSKFTQKWYNGHDLEWEIEFTWIAQEDVTLSQIPFTNSVATVDLADAPSQIKAITDQTKDASEGFLGAIGSTITSLTDTITTFTQNFQDVIDGINEKTDEVGGLVTDLFDAVAQLTQFSTAPQDVQKRVAGVLDGIKLESDDQRDMFQDADGTRLNYGGTFGGVLADRATLREQADLSNQTAVLAAAQQKRILASVKSQVLAVFQAREGDDLRRVSQFYYGTPDGWRSLMLYNDLRTDVLVAGQTVIVPASLSSGATP